MLKRHNALIFTILLSIAMSFSSAAFAQGYHQTLAANLNNQVQSESVDTSFDDEQVKVKDLDIDPLNTTSLKKSVVPDTKQEGKKVIGLFLKTLLAVIFCAVLLYVVLYFIKKYYGDVFVSKEYNKEVESLDLSTPETKEEALKSFLKRTKQD